MDTPFHINGGIKSPLRAILDRCIIWPLPVPQKVGSIELPDAAAKKLNPNAGTGVLLSIGPGYHDKAGKFHKTGDQLIPGVTVKYDKTVPWGYDVMGNDGKSYRLVICGEQDIHGVIDE